MKWFKHKTGSHDNPDISDAMDRFGDAGYSVFFIILEIYGKEYGRLVDGKLTISRTFLRRKLRKSWTKVEQILNFYSECQKILYKIEGRNVIIEIPKFLKIASNWTKRVNENKDKPPTEEPTEEPTAKEVEEEVEVDKEVDKPPIVPQKKNGYFEMFWEAYPKKKSRGQALKTWNKIKKELPDIQIILTAIDNQKGSFDWQKEGGQFIPYPSTWLNGGCWNDEIMVKDTKYSDITRQNIEVGKQWLEDKKKEREQNAN
jgi:hypothetical protein